MEEQVGFFLLDTSNKIIEEDYITKPEPFSQFLDLILKKFKELT